MGKTRNIKGDHFQIDVSQDDLTATLTTESGGPASIPQIFGAVKEMGLKGVDDGAIIEAVQEANGLAIKLAIATGVAPVDERTWKYDLRVPVAKGTEGIISKVEAKQIIATIMPVAPGTDGRDVYGTVIAHNTAPAPFSLNQNLICNKSEITAAVRGNLRMNKGLITLQPLLELHGDDDGGSAHLDFDGDVAIKGSFRDNRAIRATGFLVVGGAIEAAQVKIDGSGYVKGGIIAKGKGKCIVGENLSCRFVSAATLVVGGNLDVKSEISHSRISCMGRVTSAQGSITGGEISANGGITCQNLGNSAAEVTIVEAGADQMLRSLIAIDKDEIENNRKRIRLVREKVAPLMKHLKHLTPQQKEKATELLSEAEELHTRTDKMLADVSERCRLAMERALPEIRVIDTLHPGVIIRFPSVEAVVKTAFTGPIKIVPRKCEAGTRIEIVDEATGAAITLESHKADDAATTVVRRMVMAKKTAA